MKIETLQKKGGYYTSGNYGAIARRTINKKRICVGCETVDGKLYVHHKDEDFTNNNLDNLEYRCPSCHRKFHPSCWSRSYKTFKPVINKRGNWGYSRL